MTKPKARGAARRRPRTAAAARVLLARITALEERVARLETGRAAPGDGRGATLRARVVRRCPGCGLPLRTRGGRCAGCGRPLDAR